MPIHPTNKQIKKKKKGRSLIKQCDTSSATNASKRDDLRSTFNYEQFLWDQVV